MKDVKEEKMEVDALSFEEALQELEKIVATLERGEVALDVAISAFERGTELKIVCQSRLEEARMKVEKIKIPDTGNFPRASTTFDSEKA